MTLNRGLCYRSECIHVKSGTTMNMIVMRVCFYYYRIFIVEIAKNFTYGKVGSYVGSHSD